MVKEISVNDKLPSFSLEATMLIHAEIVIYSGSGLFYSYIPKIILLDALEKQENLTNDALSSNLQG